MMNVLSGAFAQSSSSLYFQRFTKNIEERLVAPLSYAEMVIGYLVGAVSRAVVIGIGIMLIGIAFNASSMYNLPLFLFYVVGVSIIFGLLGLLVGLWSNNFEQLTILNTFVIMPLSFIGGMFNSISMLPSSLQLVAYFNPFLYFNDGIRYSMTGYHETNIMAGMIMIVILAIFLFALVWRLFSTGWKLRV